MPKISCLSCAQLYLSFIKFICLSLIEFLCLSFQMEQEVDQVGNMADNLVSAMQPSLRDRLGTIHKLLSTILMIFQTLSFPSLICCIFRPVNGYSTCRSLVEIFLGVKQFFHLCSELMYLVIFNYITRVALAHNLCEHRGTSLLYVVLQFPTCNLPR